LSSISLRIHGTWACSACALSSMAELWCTAIGSGAESDIIADFEAVNAPGRYLKWRPHPKETGMQPYGRYIAPAGEN